MAELLEVMQEQATSQELRDRLEKLAERWNAALTVG